MEKKIMLLCICLLANLLQALCADGHFAFAVFTDLHLSQTDTLPAADLQAAVNDANSLDSLDFVLVLGDITEKGDKASMLDAKRILDQLRIPYYITAGNHEPRWRETCTTDFAAVFGDDKFTFVHKGCLFTGFVSGPEVKGGKGHIAQQDIDWAIGTLQAAPPDMPAFICTHYPLQQGDVDNWCELTSRLHEFNVQTCLGGHYHRNMLLNYDGICGVLHRSTLRGNDNAGGYTIVSIAETIRFYERTIGQEPECWLAIPFGKRPDNSQNTRNHNTENPFIQTFAAMLGTAVLTDSTQDMATQIPLQ